MPPRGRIVPDKPLRQTLAEIEETQHCPQQKIQWIVSQIAFERILHRAADYLKPGGPSRYATQADFCRVFRVNMNSLYLRSFLLTGNHFLGCLQ